MILRDITLISFAICISLAAFGQQAGTTAYAGLNIPSNARVAGIGGNALAVYDDDINLGLINPSLLNVGMSGQIGFNYVNYFSDINLGEFGAAYAVDSSLTLSAGIKYLDFGDFDRTDASGNNLGTFSANTLVASVGAGYKVDSLFSIGARVKSYSAVLDNVGSFALGVDLALTYHKESKEFAASVMLKDVGYELKSFNQQTRQKLPFEVQLGFSKKLKHAPFRFNVVVENLQVWDLTFTDPSQLLVVDPISGEIVNDRNWEFGDKLMRHIVFGTEIVITKGFQLRAGYNYRRRQELKISERPGTAGISFGAGFRIKRFHINYGRAIYHQAGPSNTFSVTTRIR